MKSIMPVVLLLALPAVARSQSARQQIDSAKALYEAFQVEAARPILQRITSPTYTLQVSPGEKAEAYKYLGASYAVLARRDSAVQYFMGALDYDPFTDLDPTKFSAAELSAFGEAKRNLFKVAIMPLAAQVLVQRDSAHFRLQFITTQRATIHVDLASAADTVVLYDGPNDGSRTITWPGVLTSGAYAPPGIYQLRIRGTSSTSQNNGTQTMVVRIEHVFEPLQDELPALDPNRAGDLLPERIRPSEPWLDLIKGAAVGIVAVGVPLATLQTGDISWTAHAGTTAVIGITSGAISFWYRRKYPQIKRNVDENTQRRRMREQYNAAVRQANQRRLERTMLVISPVSSLGQ